MNRFQIETLFISNWKGNVQRMSRAIKASPRRESAWNQTQWNIFYLLKLGIFKSGKHPGWSMINDQSSIINHQSSIMHHSRPGRDGIFIATIDIQDRRPGRDAICAMFMRVWKSPFSTYRNQSFTALPAFSGICRPYGTGTLEKFPAIDILSLRDRSRCSGQCGYCQDWT